MLKRLCAEQPRQWNHYIDALLLTYCKMPQESAGFASFELLYERGAMQISRELWIENGGDHKVMNSYQYIFELRIEDRRSVDRGSGKAEGLGQPPQALF